MGSREGGAAMRQAFAWSLVVFVLFAGLVIHPGYAAAGDPDIPQAHMHQRAVNSNTPVIAGPSRTDQGTDSRLTTQASPASPQIISVWELVARWMIAQAVHAGH